MTFSEKIVQWMKDNQKSIKAASYDLGVPRRTLTYWMHCHHEPHPDRQKVIEDKMQAPLQTPSEKEEIKPSCNQ